MFGPKTPEKRYKKAVKKLVGHIIDESIEPLSHTEIMEGARKRDANEAASAWIEMNSGRSLGVEDLRAAAAQDVFVHPWALKNNTYYQEALDLIEVCQEEFVQAGLEQLGSGST